ncbi:MAG: nucleotidyltransferase domain-containing protein [Chrysiogenales bacterium]
MAQKLIADTEKILLQLLKARGIRTKQIVFFASVRQGRHNADSDIDLIIDFHGHDIFQRLAKARGVHQELVKHFRRPFDILYYSPAEWEQACFPVVMHAKTKGQVIYQA